MIKFIIFHFVLQSVFGELPSPYENAINKTIKYLDQIRKENAVPGIGADVSVNGTLVWAQGFGQIDIENNVNTSADSVWRLASISKSLTSALVGRLIDEGKLDLNKSIYEYLAPNVFPKKTWNNKTVDITLGKNYILINVKLACYIIRTSDVTHGWSARHDMARRSDEGIHIY